MLIAPIVLCARLKRQQKTVPDPKVGIKKKQCQAQKIQKNNARPKSWQKTVPDSKAIKKHCQAKKGKKTVPSSKAVKKSVPGSKLAKNSARLKSQQKNSARPEVDLKKTVPGPKLAKTVPGPKLAKISARLEVGKKQCQAQKLVESGWEILPITQIAM